MTQRVVDAARAYTRIEGGSAPFISGQQRVAIVVHFALTTRLSKSVQRMVEELHANDYFVVLCSACEAEGDLEWSQGMPADTIVIRKPNIGYDFGTAAVALDRFPAIADSEYVLLVNDSNVGPFKPLRDVIQHFESTAFDAWGLTGSYQHAFHLQSFFLGFRGGILRDKPLARFWRDIRHFDDKHKVIRSYELGLSELLLAEGYAIGVMFPNEIFEASGLVNMSVNLWLDLLAEGYPFIKRELVVKPWIESSAVRAPAVANYFFGEDLVSWL
ncbi:hypothetical protein BH11ACT2_BH11ACT2_08800 [soil metagenome]